MPKYHKDLPKACPPADAESVDADLYRAIRGKQVKDNDFLSFAEQGRDDIDLGDCDSWGLSVWPDMDAVEHALRAIPYFQKKRIIRFSVTKQDGTLKFTPSKKQPDHHTFWKDVDCVLLNSCEIVIKPVE